MNNVVICRCMIHSGLESARLSRQGKGYTVSPPNPAGTPIRAGNSLGVSQLPNTPWNPTHAPAFMTLLFMTRRPQEERFCHPTQGTLCAFMLLALNCAT